MFEVTPECSINCVYCYNHWKSGKYNKPETYGYHKAIQTLKKFFRQIDTDHIIFTGGEPFLAERFPETVLFCRLKGKKVSIITNGYSAENTDYDIITDLGIALFELPLHSYSHKIHDAITGKSGSWQKSVESMKYIMNKNTEVVAAVVITKLNMNDIGKTIHFASELGLKRVMLNRYNIGGAGLNNADRVLLSWDELNKVFKEAEKAAEDADVEVTSNVCTPHCVINPGDFKSIRFGNCSLNCRDLPLTLDTAGNLRYCNHSPLTLANINRDKPDEFLQLNYLKQKLEKIPEFCADCSKYIICKGGCRAAAEQCGLPLDHADPLTALTGNKIFKL